MVLAESMDASTEILLKSEPFTMGSVGFLGGFFRTSGSGGSRERAMAGKTSDIRLIHRSCIELRGCPSPPATAPTVTIISLRFVDSRNRSDFLILLYIVLP